MGVYNVTVIPGDGVGPVIIESALKILKNTGLNFRFETFEAGDIALEKYGSPLPEDTMEAAKRNAIILKGPVGESAKHVVLPLRQELGLYANLRPARSLPGIETRLFEGEDVDLLIVRENSEGLYSRIEAEREDFAFNVRLITKKATERIMELACEQALNRKGKVTIVDKSNVLISDVYFRKVCRKVAERYPEVEVNLMYVDNCAYQLVRDPSQFDVIVLENMFGDILSDLASWIQGGLGLTPGANIGTGKAMFEPVHGAAFDLKDKKKANPTAMILCVKMMLEWINLNYGDKKAGEAAVQVERGLMDTLAAGLKTPDIGGSLNAEEFTEEVISRMR
ncbi:MAG: isocitrate/isopropylmalate dehydrogenase family protein [Candidatus Odinarchaeia archaeon]